MPHVFIYLFLNFIVFVFFKLHNVEDHVGLKFDQEGYAVNE